MGMPLLWWPIKKITQNHFLSGSPVFMKGVLFGSKGVELTCLAMIQVARTLGISNTEIVEKWSSASRLLAML